MENNPYRSSDSPTQTSHRTEPTQYDRDARMWAMFLHLSALLGFTAIPILGFVVPIVIWQVKKEEFPELDVHGRVVTNWMISSLIYGAIGFLLFFVLIGIPFLLVLGALGIIFPLVGSLKAHNGEVWKYPLSFPIF